jgi:hypothetical protein
LAWTRAYVLEDDCQRALMFAQPSRDNGQALCGSPYRSTCGLGAIFQVQHWLDIAAQAIDLIFDRR